MFSTCVFLELIEKDTLENLFFYFQKLTPAVSRTITSI